MFKKILFCFRQRRKRNVGGIVARRATIKCQHRDFVQNRFEFCPKTPPIFNFRVFKSPSSLASLGLGKSNDFIGIFEIKNNFRSEFEGLVRGGEYKLKNLLTNLLFRQNGTQSAICSAKRTDCPKAIMKKIINQKIFHLRLKVNRFRRSASKEYSRSNRRNQGISEKENLEIVDILVEKQTAKKPGRPIFAEMLKRIEAGEAEGILAWHP